MLCALLLLPSLLTAAIGSPTVGSPQCAQGSAVWCRDLHTAVSCGAVGHCRSTVWNKPLAKSLPCTVCQAVVAATTGGLEPEPTGADILASMTKTCEWLRSQESSDSCKQMVKTHGSAVLSMLDGAPAATPAQVCAGLVLCEPLQRHLAAPGPLPKEAAAELVAPFPANGALRFHPPQVRGGTVCQDCIQLVSRLRDTLRANLSLAEVDAPGQCEPLGPGLGPLCRNYLHQVLIPAEQALKLLPPRAVCQTGGFCEDLSGPAPSPLAQGDPSLELVLPSMKSEVQMAAGLTCEVCQDVVQELDHWLLSNNTEAAIRHALERMCLLLPSSMVQQCVTFVDNYSPSLVQLVAGITPERVCTAIRLCTRHRWVRATLSLSPRREEEEEGQGSFCRGCRRLLRVSAQNLELRSTQRDILMAFKGGCSILPLPYTLQCNRFVTQYQPVFLQSLKAVMDPVAVCNQLGACHAPRAPLLGTDQCVLGPRFWCRSLEAAEMCNATRHCERLVWRKAPFSTGKHPTPSMYRDP